MKPTVSRIVHYQSYGTPKGEYKPECRAAVITAVPPTADIDRRNLEKAGGIYHTPVSLCVLNPTGMFFNERVEQDETKEKGGTWHWPERIETAEAK